MKDFNHLAAEIVTISLHFLRINRNLVIFIPDNTGQL